MVPYRLARQKQSSESKEDYDIWKNVPPSPLISDFNHSQLNILDQQAQIRAIEYNELVYDVLFDAVASIVVFVSFSNFNAERPLK